MKRPTAGALVIGTVVAVGVLLAILGSTRTNVPAAAALPTTNTYSPAPQPRPSHRPMTHRVLKRQPDLPASTISIPAIAATATIGAATVDNGVLTPPRVPDQVGLWSGSSSLDATSGEVTIAGHVNWSGMAPFAFERLAYLHSGDLVYTTDARARRSTWRVAAVIARSKTAGIDTAAFHGHNGPRRLALITCGGQFDPAGRSYADNVYVYADPAP